MQIEEKYKKAYQEALVLIRAERKRFMQELSEIKGIRVIPSQANYVMVELASGLSAKAVTKALLIKDNILIKELTGKIQGKEYLRIAVRNTADNNRLIEALKKELA